MKKKILICLLVALCLFTIVGCGKKNDSKKDDSNITEELNKDGNFELYSDSKKIVFQNGSSKMVFYYNGEEITAHYDYIDYGKEDNAKAALKVYKKDDTLVKNVSTKGKYLVIEYRDSEYGNMKMSDIKKAYSYLKEVKKK